MKQISSLQIVPILIGLLVLLSGATRTTHGQLTNDGEGELMLLKNGSVLQGFVERTANHYSIQTRPGNRLIIPFEKVELVGDSLSEIYWRRLTTIPASDTESQGALFQWCLKYRLWREAANQIEILQTLQIGDAKIAQLKSRLDLAIQSTEKNQQRQAAKTSNLPNPSRVTPSQPMTMTNPSAASSPHAEPAAPTVIAGNESFFNDYESVFTPLPSFANQLNQEAIAQTTYGKESDSTPDPSTIDPVIQVGYEDDSAKNPDHPGVSGEPTVRELEQFIKKLPKNSLSRFRLRVEPVLISNCSDCHNIGTQNPMRLLLRNKRSPVTIRMSQRNLYSAFQQLDPSNIEASSFLNAASTAHGGIDTAPLSPTSVQFLALKEWAQLVTQSTAHEIPVRDNSSLNETANVENSVHAEPKRLQQPMAAETLMGTPQPGAEYQRGGFQKNNARPTKIRISQNRGKPDPVPPTIGDIPTLTEPVDRFLPRDEFDPEIFNRQFGLPQAGKITDAERAIEK